MLAFIIMYRDYSKAIFKGPCFFVENDPPRPQKAKNAPGWN